MGRHDLLSVSPRSWKFVVAIHGNEFHHGPNCEKSPMEVPAGKQDEKRDL